MDSSIFPTSVGANPMQTIYAFAKIFSDRLLAGMDEEIHASLDLRAREPLERVVTPNLH
jgi:choline dehydrogenase-like flavoprotein